MRDLAQDLDRTADRFQFNPAELNTLQERLSLGFRLLKKHACKRTADLLQLQQDLRTKIGSAESIEANIQELQTRCAQQEQVLRDLAQQLHATRVATIPDWVKQIDQLLRQVGMPTARFQVELRETPLQASGLDECIFLMDANYSEGQGVPNWQPVRKVASGGELSRLMLCIKSRVANRVELPTLIFDEIDTGISGEAAKQVGRILQDLGKDRQVICITHQPQVAAKGAEHLHVSKSETGQGIETQVNRLNEDQRIETLARMMSGEQPTEAARKNARELRAA
jgi:DNA repair protein RecN (Recombination protein N)